jgi:predicted kinase
MAIKKNIDPGRPVSRPMAPVVKDAGWGKTLSKRELLSLIDRIHKKQEEEKMSKMSETLAKALAKKQGKTHVDGSEANTTVEKKTKKSSAPVIGKKPPTRSAGRGR